MSIALENYSEVVAELRLQDENDPLSSGIETSHSHWARSSRIINFDVRRREDSDSDVAVIKAKPTPFAFLMRWRQRLMSKYYEILCYLKRFEDVQFALITQHKATMEHADAHGATMPGQAHPPMRLKFEDGFDPSEYSNE